MGRVRTRAQCSVRKDQFAQPLGYRKGAEGGTSCRLLIGAGGELNVANVFSARANSVDELSKTRGGVELEDFAAVEDGFGLRENLSACEKDGDVLERGGFPLLGEFAVDLHSTSVLSGYTALSTM